MNSQLSKDDVQMTNKHGKSSASSALTDMQVQTTLRFYPPPAAMTVIKKTTGGGGGGGVALWLGAPALPEDPDLLPLPKSGTPVVSEGTCPQAHISNIHMVEKKIAADADKVLTR